MSSNTASPERGTALRWLRAIGNSVFLYPLLMHVLIVNDHVALALAGLGAMSLIAAVMSLHQPHARVHTSLYLLMAVAAFVGLGGGNEFALYLPPVVFNLMFAAIFGLTLRPGATPLIERFMRLYHGESMPVAATHYARQLTIVWTTAFLASALTATLLAVFADIEVWSLFANVVNYILIAVLFVGQFVYGYLRYDMLRPTQILPAVLRMAHRAARRNPFGH